MCYKMLACRRGRLRRTGAAGRLQSPAIKTNKGIIYTTSIPDVLQNACMPAGPAAAHRCCRATSEPRDKNE